MESRLPPLTAVRAFECAGRVLSFTRAAEQLCVTPGAISRQIAILEDYLGVQLFQRVGRDVILTEAGKEYLTDLVEAFSKIRSATSKLMSVPNDAPLHITTSSTFTMRWLMPRLISYHADHPKARLQLAMNLDPVDFLAEDLDATIKLGQEDTPHSVVRRLFGVDLLAVCSPKLLEGGVPLQKLSDLDNHVLVHSIARPENWPVWLDVAGQPDITGSNQLYFDNSSLAYQAALEGVGIAIAQLPLIIEDIRAGKLVIPFPIFARDDKVYNLIWPDRTPRNPEFAAFRDWIIREARNSENEMEQVLDSIKKNTFRAKS